MAESKKEELDFSTEKTIKEFLYLKQYQRKIPLIQHLFSRNVLIATVILIFIKFSVTVSSTFVLAAALYVVFVFYSYGTTFISFKDVLKQNDKTLALNSFMNRFYKSGFGKNVKSSLLVLCLFSCEYSYASFANSLKETIRTSEDHLEMTEKEEKEYIEYIKAKASVLPLIYKKTNSVKDSIVHLNSTDETKDVKLKIDLSLIDLKPNKKSIKD